LQKTTIVDVVYYILSKKEMNSKKIQTMCYYVQGWYVANYGKFLFKEDFEAWAHGAICPALYLKFREYETAEIYVSEENAKNVELTKKQKQFIDLVIKKYRYYTANELVEYIQKEEPWINARKGLGNREYSKRIISKNSIKEYFDKRMKE